MITDVLELDEFPKDSSSACLMELAFSKFPPRFVYDFKQGEGEGDRKYEILASNLDKSEISRTIHL